MVSSAAVVSPPQPKSSSRDLDDDDDEEIEYEEIEEEIEVEEEVEEEVVEEVVEEEVDDDVEIGQDLTPVREENQENGERTSSGPKAPFDGSEVMNYTQKAPFIGGVSTALTAAEASCEKGDAIIFAKAETNHNGVDAMSNLRQMSPRWHISRIRLRDPSSSAEFDGREIKKMKIVCEFHARGWCIKGNSCRFLHIKDRVDPVEDSEAMEREDSSSACIPAPQSGENKKLSCGTEKLVSDQDRVLANTGLVAGGGSYGHGFDMDNLSYYATPFAKCHLTERNSTNHDNSFGFSSVETTFKEMVSKKNGLLHDNYRSMTLPYSYSRQPLSFGSSWNVDTFSTQNHLENRLEHCASISSSTQQSMSPVLGLKSEHSFQNHVFKAAEPTNYKATISSYNWEPSVPFRPSHIITRNLLMKEGLYDSLSKGNEQKDVGDGLVKFLNSDQGSSGKNEYKQSTGFQEEEMLLNSVHVAGSIKDNVLSSSSENKMKFHQPKHGMELKVDGFGKNVDETEVDLKRDDHMQNESKALKAFQAALIEYVKDLVKPTWREGLLSRDAHKLIVKKAVDKVISTLQQHQIPSTSESVKLYLSSSHPKLAKLVGGYIEKYGKS